MIPAILQTFDQIQRETLEKRRGKINKACAQCGAVIAVYPSRLRERNYCSRRCGSHANLGYPKPRGIKRRPYIRRTRSIRERFEEKYIPEPTTGCWLWTGSICRKTGYAKIGKGRKGEGWRGAHRLSYELHKGSIPEGLDLDHLCRTRSCVNPDHLQPVTRSVNIQRGWDARRAGR